MKHFDCIKRYVTISVSKIDTRKYIKTSSVWYTKWHAAILSVNLVFLILIFFKKFFPYSYFVRFICKNFAYTFFIWLDSKTPFCHHRDSKTTPSYCEVNVLSTALLHLSAAKLVRNCNTGRPFIRTYPLILKTTGRSVCRFVWLVGAGILKEGRRRGDRDVSFCFLSKF